MPRGGFKEPWQYGFGRKVLDEHAGDLRGKAEEATGGNYIAGSPESQQLRQRGYCPLGYCPVAAPGRA
jgi:hypothetical protein